MRLKSITNGLKRVLGRALLGGLLAASLVQSASAVSLADRPLFSTTNVPGNLMLALSVEWPTANTPAYLSTTAYNQMLSVRLQQHHASPELLRAQQRRVCRHMRWHDDDPPVERQLPELGSDAIAGHFPLGADGG
jgi:hypothetical protein